MTVVFECAFFAILNTSILYFSPTYNILIYPQPVLSSPMPKRKIEMPQPLSTQRLVSLHLRTPSPTSILLQSCGEIQHFDSFSFAENLPSELVARNEPHWSRGPGRIVLQGGRHDRDQGPSSGRLLWPSCVPNLLSSLTRLPWDSRHLPRGEGEGLAQHVPQSQPAALSMTAGGWTGGFSERSWSWCCPPMGSCRSTTSALTPPRIPSRTWRARSSTTRKWMRPTVALVARGICTRLPHLARGLHAVAFSPLLFLWLVFPPANKSKRAHDHLAWPAFDGHYRTHFF